MTTLRLSPFLLAYGDLVLVRVSSFNINGWSSTSAVNTIGATIRTEPTTMTSP